MKKVLIAGATGYLGKYVVKEFKKREYWVRALVRNPDKLSETGPFLEPKIDTFVDDVWIGDVTKPETLSGLCEDIDIVFSSVGLTRPGERVTFMDVDYKGNRNILFEAIKSSTDKFIFISVYRARDFTFIEGIKAKEMFVDELISSGLKYTIIRPTGFFSDMTQFLDMALKGRVYLIGDGENRMNPIHGADLAKVCVDSVDQDVEEVSVGGPEILKYIDIARLAFNIIGEKPKIMRVPKKLVELSTIPLKIFSRNYYTLIKFFVTAMTNDFIAPCRGKHRLKDYYKELLRMRGIKV